MATILVVDYYWPWTTAFVQVLDEMPPNLASRPYRLFEQWPVLAKWTIIDPADCSKSHRGISVFLAKSLAKVLS
jgi:hypothetical protein